jgi:hypothetical protein
MTSFQTVNSRVEFVENHLGFTRIELNALLTALGYTAQIQICSPGIQFNTLNDIIVCYISMTPQVIYRDYSEEQGFIMYQGEGRKGDQVMTRGNRRLEPENTPVLLIACTGEGNWFYRLGTRIEKPRYGLSDALDRNVYRFKIQLM